MHIYASQTLYLWLLLDTVVAFSLLSIQGLAKACARLAKLAKAWLEDSMSFYFTERSP